MLDPWGPLQFYPIQYPVLIVSFRTFTFAETAELILYELRPNSPGGGYMPRGRRLYAKHFQIAISRSDHLQGSEKNYRTQKASEKKENLQKIYQMFKMGG